MKFVLQGVLCAVIVLQTAEANRTKEVDVEENSASSEGGGESNDIDALQLEKIIRTSLQMSSQKQQTNSLQKNPPELKKKKRRGTYIVDRKSLDAHESSASHEKIKRTFNDVNNASDFDENNAEENKSDDDKIVGKLESNVTIESVENETVENTKESEKSRRSSDAEPSERLVRKFEDAYRYENAHLRNMLMWLILNSFDPTVRDPLRSSKPFIDKFVKYTAAKGEAQANLRYANQYSSIRFEKSRVIFYCGGQTYIFNTLKDHKFCYNGKLYDFKWLN